MTRLLRAFGASLLFWISTCTGALADDGTDVGTQPGEGLWVHGVESTGSATNTGTAATPIGEYHQQPACEQVCTGEYTCPDRTFATHSWLEGPGGELLWESFTCPSEASTPAVTDDLIATAFRRIPLPPSTISIQPPGGRTLVNLVTSS